MSPKTNPEHGLVGTAIEDGRQLETASCIFHLPGFLEGSQISESRRTQPMRPLIVIVNATGALRNQNHETRAPRRTAACLRFLPWLRAHSRAEYREHNTSQLYGNYPPCWRPRQERPPPSHINLTILVFSQMQEQSLYALLEMIPTDVIAEAKTKVPWNTRAALSS